MVWEPGDPVHIRVGHHVLRSLRESDVNERYLGWFADPWLHEQVALPRGADIHAHRELVVLCNERTRFMLGLFSGLNQRLIGVCRIRVNAEQRRGDVMALIGDAASRRQGIAGQLLEPLHDFLFDSLGLHEVNYWARAHNVAALRLLERLGATKTGQRPEGESLPDGRQVDVLAFSLPRDVWRARRAPLGD